jgi:RNA-directed DNA polymerase
LTRLEVAVRQEAQKLIRRHEAYATKIHEENVRRARRTTTKAAGFEVLRPPHWLLAPGFDPYRVRGRSATVAHSIQGAIRSGDYKPRNPTSFSVPKEDGSERPVSVFQVADSAVSALVFKGLVEKNRPRFSARSYAYRSDLTAHDAIQFLQSEFRGRKRVFIAEYDFRKYFENISHDHIWRTIDEQSFLMTDEERQIAVAFLAAPIPRRVEKYVEVGGEPRRTGVPPGTSISLFLANVAAAPLDRALEHLGVGFVRYADDTLVWSSDYGQLCEAVDALVEASSRMGVELNPTKSSGVSLLVTAGSHAEFARKTFVEFVGYKVSLGSLEMKDSIIERVKAHIGGLLFDNLLSQPMKGTQNPSMLSKVDRDYAVFVAQARRYLYGDLSEAELRRMQRRGVPPRRFQGLMSFYPLIDDTPRLAELDAWLATQAWLALRKRAEILKAQGHINLPPPHGLSRERLVRFGRRSNSSGEWYDLSLPSFRRIARVVRAAAKQHGPNRIGRTGDPYTLSKGPYSG